MLFSKSKYSKSKKMHKKAALNLSVEAIIVFVLAFAMLGVGIFVTDQLKNIGTQVIQTSEDILGRIEESPTADRPIVGIKKSGVSLPLNDPLELSIGFYNADKDSALEATLIVDDCKSSSTGITSSYADGGKYPVQVVASDEDVAPSTKKGFLVVMNNNNLESGETYICKLKVVKDGEVSTEYESITFFLNVIS